MTKRMTKRQRLYLEDIAVGDRYISSEHLIDAEQIVAFARQFDPQPFHLDEGAARETFFEGLAASGWHTMAITMRLLVESMPFARGIIGTGGEISWPQPTRPGDILHVDCVITAIRPSRSRPGQALVTVESHTLSRTGDVRLVFEGRLLAFGRGGD